MHPTTLTGLVYASAVIIRSITVMKKWLIVSLGAPVLLISGCKTPPPPAGPIGQIFAEDSTIVLARFEKYNEASQTYEIFKKGKLADTFKFVSKSGAEVTRIAHDTVYIAQYDFTSETDPSKAQGVVKLKNGMFISWHQRCITSSGFSGSLAAQRVTFSDSVMIVRSDMGLDTFPVNQVLNNGTHFMVTAFSYPSRSLTEIALPLIPMDTIMQAYEDYAAELIRKMTE